MAATKKTRSPRKAKARPLGLSPEVEWYMRSRGYELPTCAPKIRTDEPADVPGAMFDPQRVDKVITALGKLRHTQGRWAGRPLKPDGWQVAFLIAPVFGWVAPNDAGRMVRIIREAYVDIPRKNGKTTIVAGLLMYLAFADGEAGAQVLAVAGSKDQAQNAYRPAKQIAEKSATLRSAGVRPMRDMIEQKSTGSFLKVAASVGDLLHGANISGAGVDELHVHKSPDVLDAIESGTGAREQPLVLVLTTADEGKTGTVYARKRRYIEQLAARTISNPAAFGVVFAADDNEDPFAEETHRRANPGYGISPTAEFMRSEAAKAKDSPAQLAQFQRLHLGIRTKQNTRFILLQDWDRNAGRHGVSERHLNGRRAFGGLDLAATSDVAALCWLFPHEGKEGFDAIWRFWTPKSNLEALDKRTANAASAWVRQGHMVATDGNVIDYDYIYDQILDDCDAFDVQSIGYDPWNSTQLTNDLSAEAVPLVKVRQGYATLSSPTKELNRLLRRGTKAQPMVRHGANPVMRWMVDNLAVVMDKAGNVQPDKAHSGDKIDGVSALVDALSEAIAHGDNEKKSAYEDHDLAIIGG